MRNRTPFELYDLTDLILRRASTSWLERKASNFSSPSPFTSAHYQLISLAYDEGARYEIDRLSRATTVNLRSVSPSVIRSASKRWATDVKRNSVVSDNACDLVQWRNLLQNSFELGAHFIREYLFPSRPNSSPSKKRRRV